MITKKQLDAVEKFADKLWAKVGLDIEFTRHFLDRVNDARNNKQITTAELTRLFRQSFKKYGKKIANLGKDAQAVINDMETDINMPFVLQLDKNGELDLVAKTVMRKKGFTTPNQKFTFEELENYNEEKYMEIEEANGIVSKMLETTIDLEEATAADYAKLSDSEIKEIIAIFRKVSNSSAKKIITTLKSEMKRRGLKEDVDQLEEATAPFKSLEAAWLRTDGDKKKQARLIKKHELKPIISSVRPGSVKLGVLNKLKAKGNKPHTVAGLDAEGELIFVSNNPTKIYYPKKGKSARPDGAELKEASMETLRLRRIVELSVNESNEVILDKFIESVDLNLDWKPSQIAESFEKFINEESWIVYNVKTKKQVKSLKTWNAAKKAKAKNPSELEIASSEEFHDKIQKRKNEEVEVIDEAKLKKNIVKTHTPAAAQRLIKKLKNKFSGYKWDDMVSGTEVIYPKDSPNILRYIKKQPEFVSESSDIEGGELDEASNYKLYHKAFYSATDAAIDLANKRGFEVDEDDWFDQVSTGPRKPSKGKTNSYNIELTKNGKPTKKRLHFQVYGMENGSYELNAYVESAEVEGEELNEYRGYRTRRGYGSGEFRSNPKGGGQQKVYMIVYNVTFKTGEKPLRLTYSRKADFDDVREYISRKMPDAEIKDIKVVDKGYTYMDESTELEEAKFKKNIVKTHTPAAAQRLIKKLKNKFSGYKWDDMVSGTEVIYPKDASHILRYIKNQPEFVSESTELEEAVKWWSVTITKKTGKLSKGQNVEVKAASMAAAIKKGLKQMKVDPALVPSDAVDAKLAKKQTTTVEANELEEASDGWIAIFRGKKLEITKNDADSLYKAKLFAINKLKVPKSKQGLLAIKPAYNESTELEEATISLDVDGEEIDVKDARKLGLKINIQKQKGGSLGGDDRATISGSEDALIKWFSDNFDIKAKDFKSLKREVKKLEESTELEEGTAYVTNGKKTYQFDSTSKALTMYDSLGGTSKGWSVVTDPSKVKGTKIIKESKNDKQKDIESLKKMIKNPDQSRVKQYGGTKYVDMLKKKLAKLEEDEDPCWKGYKQLGMKDKGGKKVPNCVPEEKKLDPVGKSDGDIDNDGDEDESDKYLKNRRKAIGKAIKKDKKA